MGLITQVWYQYPDISLLLNFYHESKSAVHFILGVFVCEIVLYFQKSPPGASGELIRSLKFPPAHPKLVSEIATRWLSSIQLGVLPFRVEHRLGHWPTETHTLYSGWPIGIHYFAIHNTSFWLVVLDGENAGFWLAGLGYKYRAVKTKSSVASRPPPWKDLPQSKCQ